MSNQTHLNRIGTRINRKLMLFAYYKTKISCRYPDMIATNNILTPSSQYSPTAEHQRQAGRRCRRSRGIHWGSSLTKSSSNEKCSAMTRLTAMACLLVVAVYSTTCMSFTMPIQRTQRSLTAFQTDNQQHANTKDAPTSLFVATNGSAEESVSNNNNCEILKVVDDDFDESASLSPSTKNPAFKNTAESPAPPLNFEKYLTMQVGSIAAVRVEYFWFLVIQLGQSALGMHSRNIVSASPREFSPLFSFHLLYFVEICTYSCSGILHCCFDLFLEKARSRDDSLFGRIWIEALLLDGRKASQGPLSRCHH